MIDITVKQIKERLEYNPDTGVLTWRSKVNKSPVKIGQQAGSLNTSGYRQIPLFGKTRKASRLIWYMQTGVYPKKEIDHKNRIKSDDRWENLREATRSQNQSNRTIQSNNTSGYKGIVWRKNRSKWIAQVKLNGRYIHIGSFDNKKTAARHYRIAAKKYHGSYACIE
jgi:hypothetical protein